VRLAALPLCALFLLAMSASCTIANGLVVPDPKTLCTPKKAPAPPSGAADGPSLPKPLIFAVKSVSYSAGPDGNRPGLDLDGSCTCGASCKRSTSAAACTSSSVDNGAAALFDSFLTIPFFGPNLNVKSAVNDSVQTGRAGVLISIDGYTGQANDPSVGVRLVSSVGLLNGAAPNFDTRDVYAESDSVAVGKGFVAEGRLVAQWGGVRPC
jgi:hypothetical protein